MKLLYDSYIAVLVIMTLTFAVGTAHAAYCDAYSTYSGCDEYIWGVSVGTINNIGTLCNNYANYTSSYSTTMEIGTGYTIDIITAVDDIYGDPCTYSGYEGDQCAIWVDWNQDEDFYDAGEAVYSAFDYGFFTTTITPPSGAVLGETRMRIRLIWTDTDTMSPCGASQYGEVEDYTIEVGESSGYCDASTTYTYAEHIARVRVGDIDKASGSSPTGYSDYTAYSTQMQISQGYGITVNNGNGYYTDVCGIWVDWNQDEVFTVGEAISVSGNPGLGPYTATITPPPSAAEGETRMRVRIVDPGQGDTLSPCGTASYGEVEDYTIEVGSPYLPGRITGSKFNDLDGDGNWDGAEDGIQGWEIYLDPNDNGQYETSEPNVITGLNGFYEFADLVPGPYVVAEMERPGWQQTFPAGGGTHTIPVEPNQVVENVNFGNYESGIEVVSIPAIEDTYADSTNSDTNYGSNESFCCGKISNSIKRAYLKFDLSSIPAGKTFVSARLRLDSGYVSLPEPEIGARYLPNDNWDQMTLTWNNAPTEFCPIAADTITISIDDNFWTVTDDVEAAYWHDGIYSVVLVSADEELAAGACFYSQEAIAPEWRPYLEIEFKDVIKYGGGNGSIEDPYKIWTPEQMNQIGLNTEDWDKHFILMADIDLSAYTGNQFNIIGNNSTPFTGWFNGNGHSISNFTYYSIGTDGIGLFGRIDGMLTIVENLTLINPDINAENGDNVGALVGWLSNTGKVINCRVIGGNVSGLDIVGGLVGLNEESSIERCYSTASVSGRHNIGGLAGYIWRGGAVFSYSTGYVEGTHNGIGGLVGIYIGGTITDCYTIGAVAGNNDVGGLVGYFDGFSWPAIMRRCYSASSVSGSSDAGGLIGDNNAGSIFDCFWDTQACLPVTSSDGGTGNTTAQMRTESTFTDAGWDFVGETANGTNDVWTIWEEAYYPRLTWENPLSGDFSIDKTWMYQNVLTSTNSKLTATVSIADDPLENTGYTYEWEFILPDDVSTPPTITGGGTLSDPCCTFAAPGCDEPNGLSDSGQALTIRVTVTGDDYENSAQAEAQFGIALLGDANNDGVVNVADRAIINAFWRLGAVGSYTFTDCNINCDTNVNVADRAIANAVWRGVLGQNSVSSPCPLR